MTCEAEFHLAYHFARELNSTYIYLFWLISDSFPKNFGSTPTLKWCDTFPSNWITQTQYSCPQKYVESSQTKRVLSKNTIQWFDSEATGIAKKEAWFRVNLRSDGGLSHLHPGGGGGSNWPHLLTQKLRHGKSVRFLWISTFESVSVISFAQGNNEVTWGLQGSNWAECHVIFPKMCHYLRTYYE